MCANVQQQFWHPNYRQGQNKISVRYHDATRCQPWNDTDDNDFVLYFTQPHMFFSKMALTDYITCKKTKYYDCIQFPKRWKRLKSLAVCRWKIVILNINYWIYSSKIFVFTRYTIRSYYRILRAKIHQCRILTRGRKILSMFIYRFCSLWHVSEQSLSFLQSTSPF